MTNNLARLDHLNLTVSNFQESSRWYADVFGFEIVEKGLTEDNRPWGILRSVDSMLCIYENTRLKTIPANGSSLAGFHHIFHFALRITDRNRWEETMILKAIRPDYGGAVNYPHSTSWYIQDPSGHVIEVVLWNENKVQFDELI